MPRYTYLDGQAPMTLRQQLRKDFGLDLPIGSGFGSSREDPVVILASDPMAVAWIEMLLLNCAGKVLGRLWRVSGRNSMSREWRHIEQLQLETIELTSTEIITQQVNFYFDVTALMTHPGPAANSQGLPSRLIAYVDAATRIAFPYEIGWMHFEGAMASDPTDPGLGQTIEYKALNMKASVYIYGRNIIDFPERFDTDFLAPEFAAAAADISRFNSDVCTVEDQRLARSKNGTSYIRQDFEISGDRSVLALTVAHRNYLKMRVTWLAEPLFDNIGDEFIDAVVDLASTDLGPP
jgi:hypothetical protein